MAKPSSSRFAFGPLCLILLGPGAANSEPITASHLRVPQGFTIELYSADTPNARQMALGQDGSVYVGSLRTGSVYAVRDQNKDGQVDEVQTIATGLNLPSGVAYRDGSLYVAEVSRILRFDRVDGHLNTPPQGQIVDDRFPKDLHHGWKYIKFGPDGWLYVPVGAPCNQCRSDNEIFATLTRIGPDWKRREIFARGIRNTVGFAWYPDGSSLWFADNGRDWLGDDLPPDELNVAPSPGLHFGYPYCHAGDIPDPALGRACAEFVAPAWKFPAHVAPLGMQFYTGEMFPASYKNQLIVAQHGSWNRKQPQGYRVVTVYFDGGHPVREEVLVDGWLRADGEVLGRPADVLALPDGSLLISDDYAGALYRLRYAGVKTPVGDEPKP